MEKTLRAMIVVASIGCGGSAARPAPAAPAAAIDAPTTAPPIKVVDGQAALVCDTDDPEAARHYSAGVQLVADGDVAGAERAYLAALAADPRFCDAMDNLAVQYRRSQRVDQAIALYERSLAIAPHNQFAWQNIGVAYRMAGRIVDAAKAYQRLTELSPDNPEGWFGLGQLLLLGELFEESRGPMRRAEELYVAQGSPLVDDARMLLGLAGGQLHDWPAVRALLEPLYPKLAEQAIVNRFLGEAYLQSDALDTAKARTYLEKARALGADVPDRLWRRAHKP